MKKRLLALAACLSASLPVQVNAADDWWFDVEVIIFDRNMSLSELKEQFSDSGLLEPNIAEMNLIEEYLRPDISYIKQGLRTCGAPASPLWMEQPTVAQILATHEAWQAAQPQVTGVIDSTQPALSGNDKNITSAVPDSPPPVSATDIATYWIDFSGINDIAPVSVSNFSYCEPSHAWLSYEDNQWQVYQPDNALPAPQSVPEFLDGRDWGSAPTAHLLPYDSLALTKLSRQIRQTRGLNRLLHVAWRQPVKFGENKAESVRIIAGDNYADGFTLNGEPVEPDSDNPILALAIDDNEPKSLSQDSFFSELNSRIEAAKAVSFSTIAAATPAQQPLKNNQSQSLALVDQGDNPPIWELDGALKVYLKYINRVPYLHIDSKMKYRQPVADSTDPATPLRYTLKEVPFHQVRRVISKQIHYFDHPMFGMVVEIRRHQQN